MKIVLGLVDRILFTIGLLLALQIPHFMDQYAQRLGGYHSAERAHLQSFQDIADRQYQGDLERMITALRANDDEAVRQTAEQMEATRQRVPELAEGAQLMADEGLPRRLGYLLVHLDMDLARGTLESFRPGIPLSVDALVCGVIGGILFSLVFNGGVRLGGRVVKGRRSHPDESF